MPSIPDADAREVAALEQLPSDSRGFRRTLRLHAVTLLDDRPAPASVCGYRYRPEELRAQRRWDSVTPSGRCALCEVQVRRGRHAAELVRSAVDVSAVDVSDPASDSDSAGAGGAIDLSGPPPVDLTEDAGTERPRLSLVRDPATSERRSRRRRP